MTKLLTVAENRIGKKVDLSELILSKQYLECTECTVMVFLGCFAIINISRKSNSRILIIVSLFFLIHLFLNDRQRL